MFRKLQHSQRYSDGKLYLVGVRAPPPASVSQAPFTQRCCATGIQSVQVQGEVDGKPCSLTVHTGTESTLVCEGVTAAPNLPLAAHQLCSITGQCTPQKAPVQARIGISMAEEKNASVGGQRG